ncbi:MAG: tyrosine-type recombinase/integrase [Actinomycetota bacterium]
MIQLAAFCGLRFGECSGLVRSNLDLDHPEGPMLVIEAQGQDRSKALGGWQRVPPKTDAGLRSMAIPDKLVPQLRRHLDQFVSDDADALVFCGPRGGPMRRSNFSGIWDETRRKAGVSLQLRFHDLRHFHGTSLAQRGASLKEIMGRQGQASPAAALRYVHATPERDRDLARKLDEMVPSA